MKLKIIKRGFKMNNSRSEAIADLEKSREKERKLLETVEGMRFQHNQIIGKLTDARERFQISNESRREAIREAARLGNVSLADDAHSAHRKARDLVEELDTNESVINEEIKIVDVEIADAGKEILDAETQVARVTYPEKLKQMENVKVILSDAWEAYRRWKGPSAGTYGDWLKLYAFPRAAEDEDQA
jgi:hypothetical protein